MRKTIIRALILLIYCIPFVFLAMNEDALYGSLWFYLIGIIAFGVLGYGCVKIKELWIVIFGNILSFTSSCLFAYNFQTPKWEYYFKPFLPNQLIMFETIVVLIIQMLFVINYINKKKKGE